MQLGSTVLYDTFSAGFQQPLRAVASEIKVDSLCKSVPFHVSYGQAGNYRNFTLCTDDGAERCKVC